jgi:hypothetical protein
MLVRSSKVIHPLGVSLETPLMVPSFSSKGFTFNKDEVSEVTDALKVSKEFLTESILLSAYDLYHKHIPFSDEFLPTELTIIDSGGYETSDVYDLSASSKYSYPIKEWQLDNYKEILGAWPKHKAGIIVSYDHGKERFSLDDQIDQAENLFSMYPQFLNDFLIKPETDSQRYVQIENILNNIEMVRNFSLIGFTEKELGNSILGRMVNIANIRRALDRQSINSPIHIFGSLDPLTSILYFLAGAEVFDGLTWLKYSYFKGSAIYQSNYGALHSDLGIHVKDVQIRSQSIVNNIYTLERMKYLMKDFIASSDFSLFDALDSGLGDLLKKFYKTFETNLK